MNNAHTWDCYCGEKFEVAEQRERHAPKCAVYIARVKGGLSAIEMNRDPEWLEKMAKLEDNQPVTAGVPTIEDLLGECRECNRLVRDCGNHGPVPSNATPDCGCLFDPKTGKQVAVGSGCVDVREKRGEPEVF